MKCEQVRRMLADLSASRVGPRLEGLLRKHIAGCSSCQRDWERLHLALAWLEHVPQASPPKDLWERVRCSIASQQEQKRRVNRVLSDGWRLDWRWFPLPFPAVASALALVIAAFVGLRSPSCRLVPPEGMNVSITRGEFFSQHVNMDRGELFADAVALGAMASLSLRGESSSSSPLPRIGHTP